MLAAVRAPRALSRLAGAISLPIRAAPAPAALLARLPRVPPSAPAAHLAPASARLFSSQSSADSGPFAVVSLMGQDRRGIVRDFSAVLAKLGANVEESRMSRLGGTFAIIMLVSLRGAQFEIFKKAVADAFPGFQIHSTLTDSPSAALHDPATAPYEIAVDGPDSVGIVSAITAAVSEVGNLTSIETQVREAPFAGFKLFSMVARADLTVERVPELEKALEGIEEDFGLEIDIYNAEDGLEEPED
ncbi:hypothetical protein DFJ74DRAFT_685373 [Hyaloraphidium curvatum]|nr:hypothetical protein DFJ74DRAFT_685373 [Hyaloraphidium curvatum]